MTATPKERCQFQFGGLFRLYEVLYASQAMLFGAGFTQISIRKDAADRSNPRTTPLPLHGRRPYLEGS